MNTKNCVVLVQHRGDSEYNDFIGKFYHFPEKYIKLLEKDNLEFVYYEPTTKGGKGSYFGYGKIKRIFGDKKVKNHYYAEIYNYQPFAEDVPFFEQNTSLNRETPPYYNQQNSVRRIAPKALDEICLDGGILLSFKSDAHLIKVLGEELTVL